MKKLLVGLFVFALLAMGSQVHASTLSDALLKIQNLTNEITQLKSSLKASVLDSSIGVTPTSDLTPRISTWPGKVNQHVDIASSTWQTDADGSSGSGVDMLTYCKKFYPETTSVVEYRTETINSWHDGGNINNYVGARMSYRCVTPVLNPSITMVSPLAGGSVEAGSKMDIKWSFQNISANSYVDVYVSSGTNKGRVIRTSNSGNSGSMVYTLFSNLTSASSYKAYVTLYSSDGATVYSSDSSNSNFSIYSTPTVCPGSNIQSCTIANGTGTQSRVCNSGTWSAFGNCTITSCNPGYIISGSSCVASPVITPSITVLSPNGGETYQAGQQITVKWKSENTSGTEVYVYLTDESEYSFPVAGFTKNSDGTKGANSVLNNGSYTFITDKIAEYDGIKDIISAGSKKFKISISDYKGVSDESDNYFTIKSSTTTDGCLDGGIYSDTTGLICAGVPTDDNTPRVSFWPGKVSQHVVIGTRTDMNPAWWQTDSDGVTGSGVDKLTYCKKFYPNTTSVQEYKTEVFWGWRDRGNVSNYKGTNMTYKCVEGSINTNTPVISGVSGPQTLKVGQTGTWTVKAYSPMGGNLSYSVNWGNAGKACHDGPCPMTQSAISTQQSATFTFAYSQAGTYNPTFTVTSENTIACITTPCPSNAGTASTSLSVKIGDTSTLPAGCTSTSGYSPITGVRCDGSEGNPDGCSPGDNFSPITGVRCYMNTTTVKSSEYSSTDNPVTSSTNTTTRRTLKKGIKGDDVKILQLFLNLAADGSFGPATQQKVMEWQAANGLKVDGLFGSQSWEKAGLAD